MTEEEAKTKWCFAAVASHTDPRSGFHAGDPNWPENQPKTFACIGSACMAWRGHNETVAVDQRSGQVMEPGTIYLRGHAKQVTLVIGGYCGLAGTPQ